VIEEPRVVVYSDGSGTTGGPAGLGVVVVLDGEKWIERAVPIEDATNQKAEILAAAHGLRLLPGPLTVLVRSDSEYLVKGSSWAQEWRSNGWRKRNGRGTANVAYWEKLLREIDRHRDVRFEWIKGHNGDEWNERADRLAGEARAMAKAYLEERSA
jgi:ribonuclease HI